MYKLLDGIAIITTWLRRDSPKCMDARIYSCNQFNQILSIGAN